MATIVPPTGDTTGVADVAAINAALVSDDVTLLAGRYYYVQAGTDSVAIKIPQNRTLQGASASNKSNIFLTSTLNTSGNGYAISQSGNGNAKGITVKNLYIDGGRTRVLYTPSAATISFTAATKTITSSSQAPTLFQFAAGMRITVGGTVSNNGTYTIASVTATTIVVNESLVDEGAATGAYLYEVSVGHNNVYYNGSCMSFTGHNDYGSNNIVITDVDLYNGPVQGVAINSIDTVIFTRVTSTSDRAPVQPGHGNDFDATAYDKPSVNISWIDSTLDMYGQEAVKYENCETVSHTNCTFGSYISLTQDFKEPYSDLSGISFTSCTFTAWVGLYGTKRRHVPGGSTIIYNPTMNLTLSGGATPAGLSSGSVAGVTITAASGTPFATTIFGGTGPVGKMIAASSGGIDGVAIITGRTSDTVVTATIVNKFASTTINANTWALTESDNSGAGDVTFTNCTFNGDDALIYGSDNSGINYGPVTINSCTFNGRNSHVFPTAYTAFSPTISGNCVGLKDRITAWVINTTNPKFSTVFGTSGLAPYAIKSIGATTFPTVVTSFASAADDGYNYNNTRITAANDTYTITKFSGFTHGNVNIAFSIEAETAGSVIIDGTGTANAFISMSGTNTKLVKVSGFYIKNFTNGSSTRGITVNAATAVVEISNNTFYNCTNTTGGGSAIRIQNAQSAYIHKNVFDTCSGVTSANGGAVLIDVINCTVNSNLFKSCTVSPTGSGVLRFNAAVAGNSYCSGNVFVDNSATTAAVALSASTSTAGVIFNIHNNSFYGSTSQVAPNDINLFINNATAVCNLSNNIAYSSGATNNVLKTGSGTINYGNNCTATAFSVASGTNTNLGGNITTDPGFTSTSLLTISTTSGCYQTGSSILTARSAIVDYNERPFNVPFSMGSYELKTSNYLANARTSSTSRSSATSRTVVSITRTIRTSI